MATTAEQLAEVEAAISAVHTDGVQSRSNAGRAYDGLPLAELYKERERLEAKLRAEELAGGDKIPLRMFGVRFGKES
ncbi:MAG: hypothetical protein ACYS9X_11425 [Planctomycetota bacterium]|jgi:hypothetical protein